MTPSVALCLDTQSARHPELIGLAGENLAAQSWLRLFTSAEEARCTVRERHDIVEVWVAGSDEVEPINLAAAFKRDRAEVKVCLLAFQGTGSLMSRSNAAGVDVSFSQQAFVERYAKMKQMRGARAAGAVQPESSVRSAPRATCAPARPEQPTPSGRRGFLLPVVSGSGGAGKSAVAVLAALFAQGLGYRTLLLDFDLQFGDVRDLVGDPNALCLDELLAAPEKIASLDPCDLVPAVLAAPKRLEAAELVVAEAPRLIDLAQSHFEVVVANTGASWSEQHAQLLERSSKALFLVDQRASSLRACQHALDLCTRCGIATGPFLFAANRCTKNSLLSSIDVSCALRGAHTIELRDGGAEVEELLSAGQPLDLIAAKNELCTSLEHALVEILPGCAGRTLRIAQPQEGRSDRRFGRGKRRDKRSLS